MDSQKYLCVSEHIFRVQLSESRVICDDDEVDDLLSLFPQCEKGQRS